MKRLLALLLLFLAATAFAVPPRQWDYLKKKPREFRPCGMLSEESRNALKKKGVIRKSEMAGGLIAPTTSQILVIRVDFAGESMASTRAYAESFFDQLHDYFLENSYGLLSVSATVTSSVYHLGPIYRYNNETDTALLNLRNDALYGYGLNTGVLDDISNLTPYTYLMIYHVGTGEEDSGVSSDLWSLFLSNQFTAGGKTFDGFTVVPETSTPNTPPGSPLGVTCHEFGHQLGLPDLYDTTVNGGRSTCGAWSLMDYPYGVDNTGSKPPHLDPWCKDYLKFIDLSQRIAATAIQSGSLSDIETSQSSGFYKIPVDVAGTQEYFIVENRNPANARFDKSLPGTGLLVWHIDDAIARSSVRYNANTINSGDPHLGIDLVEADGSATFPPGQAGDAYVTGGTFASPRSNSFSGLESGIAIANINTGTLPAGLTVAKIAASASFDYLKMINYPNPAGAGYAHPRNKLTTVFLQVTRPPQEMSMTIYNLAGERVLQVLKEKFSLNLNKSVDNNWVYEYDWDGKNDSGDNVAPGMYFYRVKADRNVKVGKMAVVR